MNVYKATWQYYFYCGSYRWASAIVISDSEQEALDRVQEKWNKGNDKRKMIELKVKILHEEYVFMNYGVGVS